MSPTRGLTSLRVHPQLIEIVTFANTYTKMQVLLFLYRAIDKRVEVHPRNLKQLRDLQACMLVSKVRAIRTISNDFYGFDFGLRRLNVSLPVNLRVQLPCTRLC